MHVHYIFSYFLNMPASHHYKCVIESLKPDMMCSESKQSILGWEFHRAPNSASLMIRPSSVLLIQEGAFPVGDLSPLSGKKAMWVEVRVTFLFLLFSQTLSVLRYSVHQGAVLGVTPPEPHQSHWLNCKHNCMSAEGKNNGKKDKISHWKRSLYLLLCQNHDPKYLWRKNSLLGYIMEFRFEGDDT